MAFDILFLGRLFPRELEQEIKKKMKSGMADAANALQWNIIDGLDANDCGTIKILDYLPINGYPNGYTDKTIPEYVFQHTKKYRSDDKIVKCTNLSVVKQFCNLPAFKTEVRKWAFDGGTEKKILMMYTASTIFLQLAKYVKHLNTDIEICCIIADLPEFASAKTLHGLHKIFNDYETRRSNALYRYIDKFVLLTAQMAQRLHISVPYLVMEGIAPKPDMQSERVSVSELEGKEYILYTGTLNYEFGIGTLLEAFGQIQNPDIRLAICGFGEAEKAILESQDRRIVYLGKVDRKQALALQQRAAVLVNPRQNNEEFTKYSFPSKTMEYLASGVPVVAYKLDGIPDEYDSYLNYVPDNSVEALTKTIQSICDMSPEERKDKGERARKFVLNEKNAEKQAKRILDFLNAGSGNDNVC